MMTRPSEREVQVVWGDLVWNTVNLSIRERTEYLRALALVLSLYGSDYGLAVALEVGVLAHRGLK